MRVSGGLEDLKCAGQALDGLEVAWYCGPEVCPGRQNAEQVSPQQTANPWGLIFAVR